MNTPQALIASIHQRILNKATVSKRTFNELFIYYAIERFLYRLGKSAYNNIFILKGALVFLARYATLTRPTRDIDFLAFTESSIKNLEKIVRDICIQKVEADGLIFDPDSVKGEIIKEDAEYEGVRILFNGYLGKAKVPMRMDIGFGDATTKPPKFMELNTVLEGMSKPNIRVYSFETVVAEKYHAMVILGEVNSRMKDFYDLWLMATTMEFDLTSLKKAIVRTFEQRKTPLPDTLPLALTPQFCVQKRGLWNAFIRKNQLSGIPENLMNIIAVIEPFLAPFRSNEKATRTKKSWKHKIGWLPGSLP